jgi:hypothetical protein
VGLHVRDQGSNLATVQGHSTPNPDATTVSAAAHRRATPLHVTSADRAPSAFLSSPTRASMCPSPRAAAERTQP